MRERLDVIGGGMRIESARGQGSRVAVWVPADQPRPSESPPQGEILAGPAEATGARTQGTGVRQATKASRSAPSGTIRVLLVDDHAVVRDGIALQLLQQPDIEIVGEAADGATAIELVRKLRPDVVTMDVNMPGMNGIDAARAIHAENPLTRIIGLSMSEESEQGAAMRGAGAVHYLAKSASLDKLLAAIRDDSDSE
jgi:CheY-like chemotaxis protein